MSTVQFVEVQGETLAACIYEPNGSHRADVVLVHGFTGSKEDFSELAPLISDAGYRVLTFDNRGQHESAHSHRSDGYTMPSLGRDVIEISQHFQLHKPHLLGHSFGGLVAQQAAITEPDLWSSITMFCSGPGGQSDWFNDEFFSYLSNETKGQIWNEVLAFEKSANPRFELIKKRWHASDAKATLAHREALLSQQSLISKISRHNIPAHVVYGENDDAWPLKLQDQMAEELNAVLTVLPNCGHCPNQDNPELTAKALLDFWKGIQG